MLKVVHEELEPNATTGSAGGSSLLDEIVRDGARAMLAAALQAEVAAYVAAFADEVDADGHRLVVRNGYHAEREVTTAAEVPTGFPHCGTRMGRSGTTATTPRASLSTHHHQSSGRCTVSTRTSMWT